MSYKVIMRSPTSTVRDQSYKSYALPEGKFVSTDELG